MFPRKDCLHGTTVLGLEDADDGEKFRLQLSFWCRLFVFLMSRETKSTLFRCIYCHAPVYDRFCLAVTHITTTFMVSNFSLADSSV
jgi:hypothetical protein